MGVPTINQTALIHIQEKVARIESTNGVPKEEASNVHSESGRQEDSAKDNGQQGMERKAGQEKAKE